MSALSATSMISVKSAACGSERARGLRRLLLASLCGVLLVTGQAPMLGVGSAFAQDIPGFGTPNPDAQMFLEADELVYNDAANTVTARGTVTIFYDGYTVDADEVIYDRAAGRVLARGNVVLIEPDGNILRATSADLSDTLSEGFVDALRVETPERSFFTARTATRREGAVTTFEDGTYTACEACPDNPEGPRAWMFHADTITYDQAEQMVYYRNVRLDFFGVPIVWLPFFAHADPTVERKTGFLRPDFVQDSQLGFGVSTPYYFALSPSYDLTVTPTAYSTQGLHMAAEWRQRFETGEISLRASGIRQLDRDTFGGQPGDQNWRASLASNGSFTLNPRWRAGWNLYWQSDRRYFQDYSIETEGASEVASNIFLTGLHDRSYFDARVQRVEVATLAEKSQSQPWTIPVVDYDRRFTPGVLGGEFQVQTNVTGMYRQDPDTLLANVSGVANTPIYEGFEGQSSRVSVDLNWRRQFIGPLGQVFTPQVGFRGDVLGYDLNGTLAGSFQSSQDSRFRGMASAGLEWRWPFLITAPGSSHVLEPVAQIIVRPDADGNDELPIEDSQSLVFDASNLFDWDKYSGYDQIEGGTRANVGVRYTGTFQNGLSLSAVVGQSFHLAGENPYATPNDIIRNEANSGLGTDRSDYVAALTARLGSTFLLAGSGRFDEEDLSVRRGELVASGSYGRISASGSYGFRDAQPDRGLNDDLHSATGNVSLSVTDEWRLAGSLAYDLEESQVMGIGLGLAYQCDCYGVGLQVTHIPAGAQDSGIADTRVMLNISLRTIGGFQTEVYGGNFGGLATAE